MRTTNYEPPIPPPPLEKAPEARGNGWTKPRIVEVPMDDHYRALHRQALKEDPVASWERGNGHDEAPVIVGNSAEGTDVAAFSVTVIWLSEDTLALAFADRHASWLRYVANWGKWLAWASTHWEYERTLAVYDMARKICRGFVQPSAKPPVLLTKAQTVSAIETLARSDRRIAATAGQWDADQLLFNMTKGSAELSNGAVLPTIVWTTA